MWVYPYQDEHEHVIINMVHGILLRPSVSGIVWNMSEDSMAILREGISTYKSIRSEVKQMVPFFPLGFNRVNSRQLAYGVRNERKAYLAVFTVHGDTAEIPLAGRGKILSAKVIYPGKAECTFTLEGTRSKSGCLGTSARGSLKSRLRNRPCRTQAEISGVLPAKRLTVGRKRHCKRLCEA
jgi:alpha-galactosidase